MDSKQFNIRPASLADAAKRFQTSGEELERAIQTLQSRVLGTATAGANQVTVSWTAATASAGSPVVG